MNTKYIDLIDQTFDFPQEEFKLKGKNLEFHGIDLMQLVKTYGSPLKFTYLPKISENINRAKTWFRNAMEKNNYSGNYYYSYCTKSSHFSHVLNEALKNDIHIETSSAFDINIVEQLKKSGKIKNNTFVIYCHSGARSGSALDIMEGLNYVEVYDMRGGITACMDQG